MSREQLLVLCGWGIGAVLVLGGLLLSPPRDGYLFCAAAAWSFGLVYASWPTRDDLDDRDHDTDDYS